MACTIRIRAKSVLLTYPHCDIPKEDALVALRECCNDWDPKYILVSEERHQDGEPHLHAFILCGIVMRIGKRDMKQFDLVKKAADGTPKVYHCNVRSCKSPKDAIRYVKKDGCFISSGTCPFTECLSTKEKNELLQSKSLSDLVANGEVSIFKVPQLQKAISILANELSEKQERTQVPKVLWYYGETGAGKTRTAVAKCKEEYGEDYWISNATGQWFDGYHGQKAVILDDIRSDTWSFSLLLRLTDRYKFRVPIKGGFVGWVPELIIITAPGNPREVYQNHSTGEAWDGIEQLERRIREIRDFNATESSEGSGRAEPVRVERSQSPGFISGVSEWP